MSPDVVAAVEPPEDCPGDVLTGMDSLWPAVQGSDLVLNAIVGSAGLRDSLLCQELGIVLALANKESLVVGGELMRDHLDSGMVVPVDSEHSTIFRCLEGETGPVLGITLTASGGSARDIPLKELYDAGLIEGGESYYLALSSYLNLYPDVLISPLTEPMTFSYTVDIASP